MKNRSVEFERPEHFTCGAIGEPGRRVFYLQASQGNDVLTLRMEKQQVAALATYLAGVLADLDAGALERAGRTMAPELLVPIDEDWIAGSMAIGVDTASERIVVFIEELIPVSDEEDDDPDDRRDGASARLLIDHDQAGAFIPRAEELMATGRPLCELCGRPMDPDGHACPRRNGHGSH